MGFTLDLKGNLLGLSVARAAWKWLQDCVSAGSVRIADMCAALGRLSFALSVLDHLRPFLGPMYAWVTALENARVYRLPKAIKLIMLFLAKALAGDGRLTPVGVRTKGLAKECFRTDARAEGSEIWIGGRALDDHKTQ